MFVSDCLSVNEKGHLTISGCDTVELAEQYGTALYVMSEDKIRDTCRRYKSSFDKYYHEALLLLKDWKEIRIRSTSLHS